MNIWNTRAENHHYNFNGESNEHTDVVFVVGFCL